MPNAEPKFKKWTESDVLNGNDRQFSKIISGVAEMLQLGINFQKKIFPSQMTVLDSICA